MNPVAPAMNIFIFRSFNSCSFSHIRFEYRFLYGVSNGQYRVVSPKEIDTPHAHVAFAEILEDLVVGNGLADRGKPAPV
jgi:hypothetical protein